MYKFAQIILSKVYKWIKFDESLYTAFLEIISNL